MSPKRRRATSNYLEFSDDQWKAIRAPFGKRKIPVGLRNGLLGLAVALQETRKGDISFAEQRDQIGRISKHSAALHQAIEEHGGNYSSIIGYSVFGGSENSKRSGKRWGDFIAALLSVRETARELEKSFAKRKPRRTNVDVLRNHTWRQLARTFHYFTGHKPTFKVATATTIGRREGEVYGEFVDFVKAFMAAIPGEEVPTGNAIRQYIRKERKESYGEPPEDFSDY
jgi:hypothetical protein